MPVHVAFEEGVEGSCNARKLRNKLAIVREKNEYSTELMNILGWWHVTNGPGLLVLRGDSIGGEFVS